MKRIVCLLAAVSLCASLCACDGEDRKFDVDGAKDVIGKYSDQIEKSKDQLEEDFGKLQGILDEVTDKDAD